MKDPQSDTALEIRSVCFAHQGRSSIPAFSHPTRPPSTAPHHPSCGPLLLRNISFSVGRGEVVAIVGRSGTGKSTLQNLMTGFILPTSGSIESFGKTVTRPVRDRFAMSQESSLFPWLTVEENITLAVEFLPKEERRGRVESALETTGMSRFKSSYPRTLSGGMAKRTEMARCLAIGATQLFLDEPFAALDSLTRESLRTELCAIWRSSGTTVIFITHDLAEAYEISDRVLVLSGTPATIETSSRLPPKTPRAAQGLDYLNFKSSILSLLEGGSAIPT
ncbi:MAG: ABC transporter ATP-binding protein [Proteobacteria bacterium]|nr:ABC transporter ATP-binding protein [Pseudomonadota bacterium]